MHLHEVLFGVPLLIGVLLVFGAALGLAGFESDVETSAETEADGEGLGSVLGLGRVPLGVVVMLLTLLFGAAGMMSFAVASVWLSPPLALLVAWLSGAFFSLYGTRASSRLLARLVSSVETYASAKIDLVGEPGTVLVVLGPDEVVLRVVDRGGAELRVRGLTAARVQPGEAMLLTHFEKTRDAYRVEQLTALD